MEKLVCIENDNMQEELYKLVLKYAENQKSIDNYFVNEIISIASNYYLLDKYIKKVRIYRKDWHALASYSFEKKTIKTDLYWIQSELDNFENEYASLKKSLTFKYLYFAQVLLHEVEHAYQHKKAHQFYDIESEILNAEFEPFYKAKDKITIIRVLEYTKYSELMNRFNEFSPSERLAQINSFELISQISKMLEDENCYNFMQYYKFLNLLRGYKLRGYNVSMANNISDAPTEFYLKQVNPQYNFNKVEKMSEQLDSQTSIKLGLDSSPDELEKIVYKCKKLIPKLHNLIY